MNFWNLTQQLLWLKDFQRMNIPKLPVFTTEDGIKQNKEFFGKLIEWKEFGWVNTIFIYQ